MEFLISEKYRLELHWNQIKYVENQQALLEGCYFSGPVLKDVLILNQEDSIDLDFVNQYFIFIESFYIAKLSWKGTYQTPEKIVLDNASLKNQNLNVVPKLKNSDYIVIDTAKHEDEAHLHSLVYTSYLLKKDGTLYNFRGLK